MRDACHFFNLSHNLLKDEMVQRKENKAFFTPGFSQVWGTKVIRVACKCGLSTRSSRSSSSLPSTTTSGTSLTLAHFFPTQATQQCPLLSPEPLPSLITGLVSLSLEFEELKIRLIN